MASTRKRHSVRHCRGEGVYIGHNDLFNQWSDRSFKITNREFIVQNGDLFTALVSFEAEKDGKKIKKVKEVWLFLENVDKEDRFWNFAAKKS